MDIEEILKRTPSELDHCHALEKAITFHKDVEFLIASLTKRRNEALQMLDLYRAGMAKRVDQAMNDIVDADYKIVEEKSRQVESPALVPAIDPAVETKQVEDRSSATAAVSPAPTPPSIQDNSNDLGTPSSSEPAK